MKGCKGRAIILSAENLYRLPDSSFSQLGMFGPNAPVSDNSWFKVKPIHRRE